jgi:hypothetical protein
MANSVPVRPKPVATGGFGDARQNLGFVEFHAAGTLDQRLDDDRGNRVALAREERVEGAQRFAVARQVDDELFGERAFEQRMHAVVGIADGHRGEGVAVVAGLEADDLVAAALAAVDPELHRHLERDFDRDRA